MQFIVGVTTAQRVVHHVRVVGQGRCLLRNGRSRRAQRGSRGGLVWRGHGQRVGRKRQIRRQIVQIVRLLLLLVLLSGQKVARMVQGARLVSTIDQSHPQRVALVHRGQVRARCRVQRMNYATQAAIRVPGRVAVIRRRRSRRRRAPTAVDTQGLQAQLAQLILGFGGSRRAVDLLAITH